MTKKTKIDEIEKPKAKGVKFINYTESRSKVRLDALVDEYGAVYISIEDKAPLKITRVELK